jgi:hypothetical protein
MAKFEQTGISHAIQLKALFPMCFAIPFKSIITLGMNLNILCLLHFKENIRSFSGVGI